MTKKKSNEGEEGKQKKARSANYTSREDEFIAKAWGLATLKLKSKERGKLGREECGVSSAPRNRPSRLCDVQCHEQAGPQPSGGEGVV